MKGTKLHYSPTQYISPVNTLQTLTNGDSSVNDSGAVVSLQFDENDNEWRDTNKNIPVVISATDEFTDESPPDNRILQSSRRPEQKPPQPTIPTSTSSSTKDFQLPSLQSQHQTYAEELHLLQSLKQSLGILGAQAMNLKQRAMLLYREARRKKLYFFDALLSRTHS